MKLMSSVTPISRKEFVIGYLLLGMASFLVIGLIFSYYLTGHTIDDDSWFLTLFPPACSLVFLIISSRLYTNRLSEVFYDGIKISRLAVFCLHYIPLIHIYFLFLCLKKKKLTVLPKYLRYGWKVFGLFISLIIIQPVFFGFVTVHPSILHISKLLNPVSVHYLNTVAFETRWAFTLKTRLEKKEVKFVDAINDFESYSTLSSTGATLATAVVATEVFRQKSIHKDAIRASIDLSRDSLLLAKRLNREKFSPWKFSPLGIFSASNLIEICSAYVIENSIIDVFNKAIVRKLKSILSQMKGKYPTELSKHNGYQLEISKLESDLNEMDH